MIEYDAGLLYTIRLFSSTSILFPITTYQINSISELVECLISSQVIFIQMGKNQHLSVRLVSRIHPSRNPTYQMISHCWRRKQVRNNRPLCKTLLPNFEIVLVQLYPISVYPLSISPPYLDINSLHSLIVDLRNDEFSADLHSNQSIVYKHFLCEKVRSDCRLVTCAELFVDLFDSFELSIIRWLEVEAWVIVKKVDMTNILIHPDY